MKYVSLLVFPLFVAYIATELFYTHKSAYEKQLE